MNQGKVWLVGAGPSDAELLTLKAKRLVEQADVVVYDRLVGQGILRLIPSHARQIDVGKKAGSHPVSQEEINHILLEEAKRGQRVVRLKGGDPFLFGRGGEELEVLHAHGIPFEVVPGITSALSVPAYAGIPVTHRDFCSSLHIITAHKKRGCEESPDFHALAALGGTLIFLMGVSSLEEICTGLTAAGMNAQTSAAVLERGTTAYQRRAVGTLASLPTLAVQMHIQTPAIIVVGEVCSLSDRFHWAEDRPLGGARVVVTRPKQSAARLSAQLRDLGAEVVELPVIETRPLDDQSALVQALERLGNYRWLVFTSQTAVDTFFAVMAEAHCDVRRLSGCRAAAVGTATAQALEVHGIFADAVPEQANGAALGKLLGQVVLPGERLLLLRAKETPPDLTDSLHAQNLLYDQIAVYETIFRPAEFYTPDSRDILAFTSASTVRAFAASVQPEDSGSLQAVCIGKQTADEARKQGMHPTVAKEATLASLIDAIAQLHEQEKENKTWN